MNHCDPDLRHDRIFRGAEKAFDLEILLDPFEKQLDLPSLLVNFRDGGCRQSEVIGDETICFRRLPVKKTQSAAVFPDISLRSDTRYT